jgi:hypothetical protein
MVGNTHQYDPLELVALGLPSEVEVVSIQDLVPPHLDSLSVLPSMVDVTSGPASVHVRAVISDDLSGFSNGNAYLYSPSNQQNAGSGLMQTGGTALDGVFECDLTIPQYSESGQWTLYVWVEDVVGNTHQYDPLELAALGLPSGISVGPFFHILSIADVGNDQGRQVRIRWYRDLQDAPVRDTTILSYSIYRRVDQYLRGAPLLSTSQRAMLRYPPGEWDFVKSVPAHGEETYSTTCPTICDSTIADGMCWSVFFMRAETADPLLFFDTEPDSGYSVDNPAPGVPDGLHFASPSILSWQESDAEDFCYFTVYGSQVDRLDETAVVITHTTTISVDGAEHVHSYYHVTATDFAGNEGDEVTTSDPARILPARGRRETFALYQNRPNPGRPGTFIAFDLPVAADVSLRVFDAAGRAVVTLVDEPTAAGHHSIEWLGTRAFGEPVGTGVYFYRLEAGPFEETRQLILAR